VKYCGVASSGTLNKNGNGIATANHMVESKMSVFARLFFIDSNVHI